MTYDWYSEIDKPKETTQGDIIFKSPVPILNNSVYDAVLSAVENKEETEAESAIDVKEVDLIILSQACDIENDKIDSLVVCPIWSLKTLIQKNDYFNGSKARESLRQGKEPAYHLLNEYSSDKIVLPFSVVDFHRIYSLPKSYINNIVSKEERILRLLPPYREHLSQAFARYFMRVGLPVDINKEDLKATSQ